MAQRVRHTLRPGRSNMPKLDTLVFVSALATSSCVTSPTNEALSSPDQPLQFSGYGVTANAQVQVQAVDITAVQSDRWMTLATTTTASKVTIPADTIAQNPELYSWR
jgi:hypothetical protein